MPSHRPPILRRGWFAGLVFGAVVASVALLNHGQIRALQWVTNFFAAPSVYLARGLAASEALSYVIFFVYWSCLGAVFGWLMKGSQQFGKTIGALLVLALAGVHAVTQRQMEQEISNSIEALFRGIFP
jgi:hypothetical protein